MLYPPIICLTDKRVVWHNVKWNGPCGLVQVQSTSPIKSDSKIYKDDVRMPFSSKTHERNKRADLITNQSTLLLKLYQSIVYMTVGFKDSVVITHVPNVHGVKANVSDIHHDSLCGFESEHF